MAAFGAGALLAALSVELVAPTAMAVVSATDHGHHGDPATALVAMLAGAIVGGILFVVLDQIVSANGGYLRKTATTITYFTQRRHQRLARLLERLGRVESLRALSGDALQELVEFIRPDELQSGEVVFEEGDEGDRLLFIEDGQIGLSRAGHGEFKVLGAGDVVGEIALLTGAPRVATATARARTRVLELHKEDFDRVCERRPELVAAVRKLASERLEENRELTESRSREQIDWARQAAEALRQGAQIPSALEVQQAAKQHSGAPLAIWLGILLDGIPESFVIGAGFVGLLAARLGMGGAPSFGEVVPYTLIAGLFLSNFPEAMSSSVGMRNQGWGNGRILGLWLSLMLATGIGAVVGYSIGAELTPAIAVAIEGLAAGAMLTMIAQTMIPEAVHLGGPGITGLSTLAGFVAAVSFKLLEA
jgi:CRP-like cAMP-binding protein